MKGKRKALYALLVLFTLLLIFWIVALFIPYEGEYGNLTAWLGVIGNALGVFSIIVSLKESKKGEK